MQFAIPEYNFKDRENIERFCRDYIEQIESNSSIVEMLRDDNSGELANAIFQIVHSIKGFSDFLGLKGISAICNALESLLETIRKQNQGQSEETIMIIGSGLDFISEILSVVEQKHTDKDFIEEVENIIIVIEHQLSAINEISNTDNFTIIDVNEASSIDEDKDQLELSTHKQIEQDDTVEFFKDDSNTYNTIDSPDKEDIKDLIKQVSQTNTIKSESITDIKTEESEIDANELISDDMLVEYTSSSEEFLDSIEDNLIALEKKPNNDELIAEIFGAVHSLKGNSGFMGLSEIENISMAMEEMLQDLRAGEIEYNSETASFLLTSAESIRDEIDILNGKEKKIVNRLEEVNSNLGFDNNIQLQEKEKPKQDIETKLDNNNESQSIPQAIKQKNTSEVDVKKSNKKNLRVDSDKIDRLFDLVGELITVESIVSNNNEIKSLEIPGINESLTMLNKITRELQEVTLSVRMTPLESLFNKMKRLVRDVSIKMNKPVELEISGSETEMDKTIIEEISDPLVHILRNSIDHGIETKDERIKNGKKATGTIILSAGYEGNEIIIQINDDGKGINKEKVLAKALEKGLIDADEELSDKEIYNLIIEPGFSTAEKVTDISGRGVGMDVVKKNIEKLKGDLIIDSEPGQGTKVSMRIPLTLAILEAMLIRINDSIFAIPILNIKESIKPEDKDVHITMDGLEVINVRNKTLPIIRLEEILELSDKKKNIEDGIIIITEIKGKQVCLLADEIIGQQQAVIKNLSSYIGRIDCLMGCMILADGEVGLILDVESTIELAENGENLIKQEAING